MISSYGQGTIRGKITDENGEPLTGATISLKAKPTTGTITDYDGKFSIKLADTARQTLVISFISYQTIEDEVGAKKNEILIRNYTLVPASTTLEDVIVTAKQNRASEIYMELIKTKSAISLDYISSETIKKTGDSRVDDAIKRITGVSTVGSFITVRGIGDRYVKTTLNGSRIPTLDPFTNNIRLDIFPTNLVDNIVITKTSTANIPSDWSGAFLSIETKDYPEKLSVSISTTFGYNTQSTFREVVSSQHGPTDWLGFDNKFRDIDHLTEAEYPLYTNPSYYDEFEAIDALQNAGLIEYLSTFGFDQNNANTNQTFYRLGLVKLGLLSPGHISNENEVALASAQYNTLFDEETFEYINSDVVDFSKSLPNNWATTKQRAPIDFSQEFSIGNQLELFKRPLGYLFGFRYGSTNRYDPNASGIPNVFQGTIPGEPAKDAWYEEQATTEVRAWSALLSLAYLVNPNHNISLLFMPNVLGSNEVRFTNKHSEENASNPEIKAEISEQQKYEERRQFIYQIRSEHFIPGPKLRILFNASYTNGKSNSPDFKNVGYLVGTNNDLSFPQSYRPDRYFRYLEEKLLDSYISFELPFFEKPGLARKISFGAAYQHNDRTNSQYLYRMVGAEGMVVNNDLTQHFDLEYFNIEDGYLRRYYIRPENPVDFGFGYSKIAAGYGMLDYSLNKRIRISSGLRVEKTNMMADVQEFYNMGLPPDDSIRIAYSSFSTGDGGINVPSLNASEMDLVHYLPSLNLVFKLRENDLAPVNMRLSYGRTIARPSIREVSPFYIYDYSLRSYIVGNPELNVVSINNFDFRLESYFTNGDNISASLFFKSFENHIELIQGNYFTWENADESTVIGIELEGKKKLMDNLDFRANITLVDSRTRAKSNDVYTEEFHPMFGQAPYVFNAILGYTSDQIGFSATASYNVQGPKLIALLEAGLPDVYELPRHLVDIKITKDLGKYFNLSLKIRNLLNSPIKRSYNYNDWVWNYQKYSTGTDISLGLSYNL